MEKGALKWVGWMRLRIWIGAKNEEWNWERKVGKSIKGELKDGSIEGV